MIVWGGSVSGAPQNSGGRYDPVANVWTPTSIGTAPEPRINHVAVWTGSKMIVWGGRYSVGPWRALATGGVYDPTLDAWTPTSLVGAPGARTELAGVWTGQRMVVWGGTNGTLALNSGGQYDPVANVWTATTLTGAPPGAMDATGVWTGTSLLVWGGTDDGGNALNTGGQYDPALDSWTPITTTGAPVKRHAHTTIWTGSRMIVWGGWDDRFSTVIYYGDGASYDPATDVWTGISLAGAPSLRGGHTAIWTGSRMIVWGGLTQNPPNTSARDGGIYDPVADTWSPTPLTNAPTGRFNHTCVWTGSRMIVWGGSGLVSPDSGGVYDPAAGAWTTTSTVGAPIYSTGLTSVWTGAEMITWGGNVGGRYTPFDPNRQTPDEVNPLSVGKTGSTAQLSWSAVPAANTYSVTRGVLSLLSSNQYGTCLSAGLVPTSYDDSDDPGAGQGFLYLVQGVNDACGLGSLGDASSQQPRTNANPGACP